MYEFVFKMQEKRERQLVKPEDVGLISRDGVFWDGNYKYSNLWFHRDQKRLWDALSASGYWPAPDVKSYLEIGVCEGASFIWFLDKMANNSKFDHAMAIDPWRAPRRHKQPLYDRHEQNFTSNISQHSLRQKVRRMRESSTTALAKLVADDWVYDCIYIDGDHLAQQALYDMVVAWRLLSVGGVMIVDDLHRRFHNGKPQVREAVDAFFMTHEKVMNVPYRGPRQIVMIKEAA